MDTGVDLGRQVSNTLIRLALEHAEVRGGAGSMAGIVQRAGDDRPLEVLLDDSGWSSYDQLRRLLEATVEVLGGVEPLTHVDETATITSGSMPSATEMLQLLGSPHALFEAVAEGRNPAFSFTRSAAERTGPSEWIIELTFKDGFGHFPAFCALNIGAFRTMPRLFGYTHTIVAEETCLCRGDDACRFRVWWDTSDEAARQQVALEQRVGVLERRLEQFHETVADLVLADDLETTLGRVVASVALSVRAPGFVLAIDPMPGLHRWVYSHGVADVEAERVAKLVLSGEACAEVGELVVDVASTRRHYGRLAVYDPNRIMFDDGGMLKSYARLAATALDSACAIEDSRRESARGRALLDLSAALADITTIDAIAASLTAATPTVIGADRATLSIADWEQGSARILSSHGYPPATASRLAGFETPIALPVVDKIAYPDDADLPVYLRPEEAFGTTSHVVVPIHVEGEIAGWLTASVVDDSARLAPSDDLEARLTGLAAQASAALRNAQLLEQIRHQALHDALTGLPNRALILDRAEQMLVRRDHTPLSALFLDLDDFKAINDTLGHSAGDQLLRAVASRLSAVMRESDTLARLGGDEFVILVDGMGLDPEMVAGRVLEVLREPFLLPDWHDVPVRVTVSIGIATAARDASAGDLLRNADVALYEAKSAGKNCSMFFAPPVQASVCLQRAASARGLLTEPAPAIGR